MNARTRSVVVGLAGVTLLGAGGPALAHVHQVCTPGAADPIISEEPYHGGYPGQSHETRQDLDTNPNHGIRGFHPIHESLHMTNATRRDITVVVVGSAVCP